MAGIVPPDAHGTEHRPSPGMVPASRLLPDRSQRPGTSRQAQQLSPSIRAAGPLFGSQPARRFNRRHQRRHRRQPGRLPGRTGSRFRHQRVAGHVRSARSRSGVGSRLLDHTIDRLAERIRYRVAARWRGIRFTERRRDVSRFNSERSRLPQPIHHRILSGVMAMRKIFAAIVLATLTIGFFDAPASAQENISPAEHKRLLREGAQLWPVYCNTCHNARPGSEKAPYEWDMIIMHMRTLGNLPAGDVRALTEYLKAR